MADDVTLNLSSALDLLSRFSNFQPTILLENVLIDLEKALIDLQKAPPSQSNDPKEENESSNQRLENVSHMLKNCCDIYAKCLESYQNDSAKEQVLFEKASTLIEISMKMLEGSLNTDSDVTPNLFPFQGTAISVLDTCFHGAPSNVQNSIIEKCCDSIEIFSHDKQFTYGAVSGGQGTQNLSDGDHGNRKQPLDGLVAMEILRHILRYQSSSSHYERILEILCEAMLHVDDKSVGKILGTVIPQILKNSSQMEKCLEKIWGIALELFNQFGQKSYQTRGVHALSERPILILTGLADWFFPVQGDLVSKPITGLDSFWTILQSGFYHGNPLTRKRSMYLLKRILDTTEKLGRDLNTDHMTPLFWWTNEKATEFSALWQHFILLMETLEEKQVNSSVSIIRHYFLKSHISFLYTVLGPLVHCHIDSNYH